MVKRKNEFGDNQAVAEELGLLSDIFFCYLMFDGEEELDGILVLEEDELENRVQYSTYCSGLCMHNMSIALGRALSRRDGTNIDTFLFDLLFDEYVECVDNCPLVEKLSLPRDEKGRCFIFDTFVYSTMNIMCRPTPEFVFSIFSDPDKVGGVFTSTPSCCADCRILSYQNGDKKCRECRDYCHGVRDNKRCE